MTEKEFHKISPRGNYLVGKKFNKVTVVDFDKKDIVEYFYSLYLFYYYISFMTCTFLSLIQVFLSISII